MTRLMTLDQLIVQKPRPETTLSLVRAFREQAADMVESYVFTDSIRGHFTRILETVATGRGQGYWVQAEYGAGKTHFLAALAALLANHSGDLWSYVHDVEVRQYERRLQDVRLFPVVVSLRGMGDADALTGRSLLDVLLEEGFQRALEERGLDGGIQVTAADDYLTWLAQTSPRIREDISAYVRSSTGRSIDEYQDEEGSEALARAIAEYCQQHAISPDIAAGVKDRLGHIYRQLIQADDGHYKGLLVVIDEYEGWERSHPSPQARAQDEDVLETLAYLLPHDLGYRVYTIVASQSSAPAKLRGGAAGDRFINIPLLATSNERDYDVIVARRVRGLNGYRDPEIIEHYEYCRRNFEFAASMKPEEFREIFPFQPRCFEVVRHITARDLPTARSGISVFYEVVNNAELLHRDMLIRIADLLRSPHLAEDCLPTPVYQPAFRAYKVAREALPTLEIEPSDLPLACDVLDTLFLWHLAYQERPRSMSLKDLAQATLTTSDFLRAEDNVAYVLGQMQPLRQIRFEGQQASFMVTGDDGPLPMTLFAEYRRKALADTYQVQSTWTNSLFMGPTETRGKPGPFANYTFDQPKPFKLEVNNLEYNGEVVVASRWRPDLGLPLPKEDTHFRLVILTPDSADAATPEMLQDPRIAVITAGTLSEEASRAAADYLAWQRMGDDYAVEKRSGRDADAMREWLAAQQSAYVDNLVATHLRQYHAGRIVTRDSLAISAHDLASPSEDRRLAAVVTPLLAAAYPQLPFDWQRLRSVLRTAEIARVFNGYFARSAATADKAATKNYGTALGLSAADRPEYFAPQQPRALDLIGEMLAEREGEAQVWRIFEKLSSPPYGLPYPLILLYLLAFVRRGDPRVELVLKRGHKVRDANGQAYSQSKLTASSVVDVQFRNGLERELDVLVTAAGPTWSDAVPFAREIQDDLRTATDPSQVEAMSRRLAEGVQRMGEEVNSTRRNLAALQRTLGGRLPDETSAALDHLNVLAEAAGSYEPFYAAATEIYTTPDALRDDRRTLARLKDLAQHAAEIAHVRTYLDAVRLRPSDGELEMDRMAILVQLNLDNLAGQPQLWSSMNAQFEGFQGRYRIAYQKHHRDTHDELQKLQEALIDTPHRLAALELLNGIIELGDPVGRELPHRHVELEAKLQPCTVAFASLTLEAEPTCTQCRLTLQSEAPSEDVKRFRRELEQALQVQQRRLASEAIRRVLNKSGDDAVAKFVQVVQTSDLAALVNVMDERLAAFIAELLAGEDIPTVKAEVLRRFADKYPTLEEADLPAAVESFKQMLEAAFAEARNSHNDKKAVRLTLR